MSELHAPMQRREAAVAGRLIEHRVALGGLGKRLRIALLLHLKSVETGAQHEYKLIAQDLPGGTQLATPGEAFAQEARLTVGTAVAERRKHQRHRGEAAEMRHEIVDIAVVRPDHADLAGAPKQRFRIFQKPRG